MVMETEFSKGDYVRKKNYDLLGRYVVAEIFHIRPSINKKGEHILAINGKFFLNIENIVKSTKEEAETLQKLYEECKITESLKPDLNTSCIREDNGQPKRQIWSEKTIINMLFMYRMKQPEGGFEAYKCAHCGAFHLGKTINL